MKTGELEQFHENLPVMSPKAQLHLGSTISPIRDHLKSIPRHTSISH